jgi:hypothetical protein
MHTALLRCPPSPLPHLCHALRSPEAQPPASRAPAATRAAASAQVQAAGAQPLGLDSLRHRRALCGRRLPDGAARRRRRHGGLLGRLRQARPRALWGRAAAGSWQQGGCAAVRQRPAAAERPCSCWAAPRRLRAPPCPAPQIAGAAEACIDAVSIGGFTRLKALSTGYNDTPERASRPFDKGRPPAPALPVSCRGVRGRRRSERGRRGCPSRPPRPSPRPAAR